MSARFSTADATNVEIMEPLGLSVSDTAKHYGRGTTYVYGLLNQGELESYPDGNRRMVTLESIRRRDAKLLEARGQKIRQSPSPRIPRERISA